MLQHIVLLYCNYDQISLVNWVCTKISSSFLPSCLTSFTHPHLLWRDQLLQSHSGRSLLAPERPLPSVSQQPDELGGKYVLQSITVVQQGPARAASIAGLKPVLAAVQGN